MFNQMPSIHDSFNAKTLTTKALCESFIINDYFAKVAGKSHSILIGPRGSGKTTLMKMLQVEALEYWSGYQADAFRSAITYAGVFIPTDRVWKYQYEKLKEGCGDNENVKKLNSIFIYHVLERFVSVVEFRTNSFIDKSNKFLHAALSKNQELELVKHLSDSWGVSPKTLTLKSLELELLSKKQRISNDIINKKSNEGQVPDNFHINQLVPILEFSVKTVNSFLNQKEQKWCFLFDELELAPEEVVQPLVSSIRGGPEDILFKLSMSPYHGGIKVTSSPYSPMVGQDHTIINLSNNKQESSISFAKKLCGQLFRKKGFLSDVDSYFEAPKKIDREKIFTELIKKDKSFSSYLDKNGINVKRLDSYKEVDKLPTIRKVQFVAQLRNYYLKSVFDGRSLLKSRRTPADVYVGFDNLCKAMEYNPRMLIGMTNMFLECLDEKNTSIKIADQITTLEKTYRSYQSLLNTISIDFPNFNTIYELIDFLAKKCADQIKGDRFEPEPDGTFYFDKEPPEKLKVAIGYALNAGALISENIGTTYIDILEMKELKFRLSFIFSHKYGLLMVAPREVKFDTIFNSQSKAQLGLI